jgi:dATP pyrophosphohydrolase
VPDNSEVVLNEEHSHFSWFSFEEAISKLPFAGQRKVLRHIHNEFIQRQPVKWLLINTV